MIHSYRLAVWSVKTSAVSPLAAEEMRVKPRCSNLSSTVLGRTAVSHTCSTQSLWLRGNHQVSLFACLPPRSQSPDSLSSARLPGTPSAPGRSCRHPLPQQITIITCGLMLNTSKCSMAVVLTYAAAGLHGAQHCDKEVRHRPQLAAPD